MKKFFLRFSIILAALFFAVGCQKDKEEGAVIAAILKNGNVEYWQQMVNAIATQSLSMGFGYAIVTVDSDDDIQGQIDAIDTLKKISGARIAGLVIAPVYTENDHSFEQAVAEFVTERNINLVVVDTPIDEQNSPVKDLVSCYVGTDNAAAGELLASKVSAPASEVLTAMLSSSSPALIRSESFHNKKGETTEWITLENQVESQIDSVMEANPDIEEYVFFNGSMCNSVLEKLKGKRVYTFDMYHDLLQSLVTGGCVRGIMVQDTYRMGYYAAMAAAIGSAKKNVYVDPLYISSDNLTSDSALQFLNFYGLNL